MTSRMEALKKAAQTTQAAESRCDPTLELTGLEPSAAVGNAVESPIGCTEGLEHPAQEGPHQTAPEAAVCLEEPLASREAFVFPARDSHSSDREWTARQQTGDPGHRRWNARTLNVSDSRPVKHRVRLTYVLFAGVVGLTFLVAFSLRPSIEEEVPAPIMPTAPPLAPPSSDPILPATPEEDISVEDKGPLHRKAPTTPVSAITITRRASTPRMAPLIAAAYAAYQRGDFAAAHDAYWEALQVDPNDRNALLGLAAIATRNGDTAQAREFYLRLFDRDPNDVLALAGLWNLLEPADLRAQESRIKSLLSRRPDAYLYSALGTLYAHERRWSDASAAFASAFALDERDSLAPEIKNPDFAFNLAVSLEYLGKKAAALANYRSALKLAAHRMPHFSTAIAEERIAALTVNTERSHEESAPNR